MLLFGGRRIGRPELDVGGATVNVGGVVRRVGSILGVLFRDLYDLLRFGGVGLWIVGGRRLVRGRSMKMGVF